MKYLYFALAIFVSCLQLEGKIMEKTKPLHTKILTDKGKPTEALEKLLKLENIKESNLQELVDATQKQWLRAAGKERWEQKERACTDRSAYLDIFQQLGLIEGVDPKETKYDFLLVTGATSPAMQFRMSHVLDLFQTIKVKKLFFLAGQRDRDFSREPDNIVFNPKRLSVKSGWQKPTNTPKTETDLAKIIIDQVELPKDLKITVVDAPKQKQANGTLRNPNTGDTFKEWSKESPKPGKGLIVSSSPFIGYMESVALTYLPDDVSVEIVGPKASDQEKISTYLDNLARWIYQENIRRKNAS